jgi:NADH-quinone oxidoreductase subunit E
VERQLGIEAGETTEDMRYSLETVNCLGACALGPIVVVDGKYHGQVSPGKVKKVLRERRKKLEGYEV